MRAICINLGLTSSISPYPHSLFVLPRRLSRLLSKNALSFFLHRVIIDADALWEGASPRAHSIRGVATSAAFLSNCSVSKVLEAATWGSNPVFASFYFRDISFPLNGCSPFVAAGSVLA